MKFNEEMEFKVNISDKKQKNLTHNFLLISNR